MRHNCDTSIFHRHVISDKINQMDEKTVILLVEDEISMAQLVKHELEIEGYQVYHAADGMKAVEMFELYAPQLIILDLMLPLLDGLEVLRRIRKTSAVPVLILTARGEPTDRVVGLELGADDYLVKPFNLAELLARVRAILRRFFTIHDMLAVDKLPANQTLHYGSLSLDPQAHSCTLENHPIELTHIEFELLSLLMTNPGRTFNRNYLTETVWKASYIEGDRAIDNTIMRLRKKIQPLSECLETVRSVGYRLRPVTRNQVKAKDDSQ